jgi:hypothetical protein
MGRLEMFVGGSQRQQSVCAAPQGQGACLCRSGVSGQGIDRYCAEEMLLVVVVCEGRGWCWLSGCSKRQRRAEMEMKFNSVTWMKLTCNPPCSVLPFPISRVNQKLTTQMQSTLFRSQRHTSVTQNNLHICAYCSLLDAADAPTLPSGRSLTPANSIHWCCSCSWSISSAVDHRPTRAGRAPNRLLGPLRLQYSVSTARQYSIMATFWQLGPYGVTRTYSCTLRNGCRRHAELYLSSSRIGNETAWSRRGPGANPQACLALLDASGLEAGARSPWRPARWVLLTG